MRFASGVLQKLVSPKSEIALRQQGADYDEEISEVLELTGNVLLVEYQKTTMALKEVVSMERTITM